MKYTTMARLVPFLLKEFASENNPIISMRTLNRAVLSAFKSLESSGYVISDAGIEKNGRWHSLERELCQSRQKKLVFGDERMNPFEQHAYLYTNTYDNALREIDALGITSHDERRALANAAESCYISYYELSAVRNRFQVA